MIGLVRTLPAALLAIALPPRCPACGIIVDGDDRLCAPCWGQLRFLSHPMCARCGTPFDHHRGDDACCAQCLARAPEFSTGRAAVAYDDLSRRLLLRLKHGGHIHAARLMGAQMRRLEPSWLADPNALIIPVPLARWRLWGRGYNQALLIARALAPRDGARVEPLLLRRTRETRQSGGLSRRERARNVEGAFTLSDRARAIIRNKRIVLIDDVYTTGATANACSRALMKAGAAEVRLLCWARVNAPEPL